MAGHLIGFSRGADGNQQPSAQAVRDEPRIQVLMASMAMILFASFWAAQGGRIGLHALAVAVTALSLLRDLRPDLLRKLVPAPRAR